MGINCLAKHKVTTDCEKKLITFSTPKGERLEFKGNGYHKAILTISAMQAFKMLRKGVKVIYVQLRWQNLKNQTDMRS